MKTIGILTHYQVHNHGAILQMHGLYHTLENLGWNPCVLTYQKNLSFIDPKLAKKYNISLHSVPFYAKYICTQNPVFITFQFLKRKVLNNFMRTHYRFEPLQQSCPDAVVIGSDEVFSLEVGVNIMMYGHTVPAGKVFSYAASFGQTDTKRIADKHCTALIANGLKMLKAICVRDKSSADTVAALTGITPQICFDPVLLYGFEKELQNTSYCVPKQPYLVIYAYSDRLNTPQEIEAIKSFARKHGLKIVSPGFYHKWADKSLQVTPLELLKVIQSAQYVVTDTFHGTVMAALLNRPFAVLIRESNRNKISYLLDSLGLQAQRVNQLAELETVLLQPVNWPQLNQTIQRLREEGISYLQGVLNEQK